MTFRIALRACDTWNNSRIGWMDAAPKNEENKEKNNENVAQKCPTIVIKTNKHSLILSLCTFAFLVQFTIYLVAFSAISFLFVFFTNESFPHRNPIISVLLSLLYILCVWVTLYECIVAKIYLTYKLASQRITKWTAERYLWETTFFICIVVCFIGFCQRKVRNGWMNDWDRAKRAIGANIYVDLLY